MTNDEWEALTCPSGEFRKRMAEATVAWRKSFADRMEGTRGEQILDLANILLTQLCTCAFELSPHTTFERQCLRRFINIFCAKLTDTPADESPDYASRCGLNE